MQSPEGSRLRGFYFRLHPLMSGERGGENTSVEWEIHYCERWIVFLRQDAVGRTANDCGFNRSSQQDRNEKRDPMQTLELLTNQTLADFT
jgi:hypothetical protein